MSHLYHELRTAIESGDLNVFLSHMIQYGGGAVHEKRKDYKVLTECAYHSTLKIFEAFLEYGGDPDIPFDNQGSSALKEAAEKGDIRRAQALLKAGADPNGKAGGTKQPLQMALEHGQEEVACLLVKAGAQIDSVRYSDGDTLLKMAAFKGFPDFVRTALEYHANPNLKGSGIKSPLAIAAEENQIECARVILEGGGDPNFIWGCTGNNIFKDAVDRHSLELIELLIEFGVDLQHRAGGRYTNLEYMHKILSEHEADGLAGKKDSSYNPSTESSAVYETVLKEAERKKAEDLMHKALRMYQKGQVFIKRKPKI